MDKNNRSRRAMQRMAMAATALAALASAAPAAEASGPERSLAGIAIFAPGSQVTRRFGNPSQILVGGVAPGLGGAAGATAAPAAQGGFPSAAGGNASAGAGTLPGFPAISSGGFPGAPTGGASSFPGGAVSTAPVKQPVTLIYNRANGGSLEFTVSPDKRVIQIRETGYIGNYATSRGIKLGMPYSAVIARYGYPENTAINGPIINIDYKDTLHCGFQFLDQRLVGIIVASPD